MTDPVVSARMARVKSKGTALEIAIRRIAWARGLRFRKNNRALPGSPDIANLSRKWAIFANGCFWHSHGCRKSSAPKTNAMFWSEKFARNKRRDARVQRALRRMGYRVVVAWECELEDRPRRLEARIAKLGVQPIG